MSLRFRVASIGVLCLLQLQAAAPVQASIAGVGVIKESPLAYATMFYTEEDSYQMVAYEIDESSARIVLARTSGGPGVIPMDDVVVPESAISLSLESGLWKLRVRAMLPTLGSLDVVLVSNAGFEGYSAACIGFYEFVSPSAGLSSWGDLYGSVNGDFVQDQWCREWGSDVSGAYRISQVSP